MVVGIRERTKKVRCSDGRKERHERGEDESDQRRPAEYVQWHARASESPSENAKPSCKACAMVAVALCSASDSVLSR